MNIYILIQQLINGLFLGTIYGLIAIGYTMVYGIIGMINFAHGDIYMVAAFVTAICIAILTQGLGLASVPAIIILTLLLTMVVIALHGIVLERVAYKPLRNAPRLAPLITTIGVSLFLQNYILVSQGAQEQSIPSLVDAEIRFGNELDFVQITYLQIMILVVACISMISLYYVIQKTKIGRYCRATQQDLKMARILGVNTDKTIAIVFMIGSGLAAIAGTLITISYSSFNASIGFHIGIKAFTAAVVGGIGSVSGAMLGGVLLGMLESLFEAFFSSDYKNVFAFMVLIGFLLFRPNGILGKPAVQKV